MTNSSDDRGRGYQGAAKPGDTPENMDENKEDPYGAKERAMNKIKDVESMALELHEEQREDRYKVRKYKDKKGEIVSEEKVGSEIAVAREALSKIMERGRVDLWNIEEVVLRTEDYFLACEKSGTFPSMMGLCSRGFGMTRDGLYKWMDRNPGTPTTEYIGIVQEMMADILTNASLRNKANVAQTIFQLKNHFGHTDEVRVKKVEGDDPLMAGASSQKEIEERYRQSVVWDD